MATDLIGRNLSLSVTAGSNGTAIATAEGVITQFRVEERHQPFTGWAKSWERTAPFSRRWSMTVRCTVNSATGSSNGNPQIPKGVAATITLLKNSAAAASGKWTGSVHPSAMVLVANANQIDPQTVEYTLLGQGKVTETL